MKLLITGGTNGMGKGVARIVADADNQAHEIILLCKSKQLGEAVAKELTEITSNSKISVILCDLAKLSDIRRASREIHNENDFLDGLFINAGLGYTSKRIETEDGLDSHFQVNYLSQFMLTLNLLDLLEKSDAGGRVIFNVTKNGEIVWNDMQKNWSYKNSIHQAMVAKRMFLHKLHKLYSQTQNSKVSFIGFEIPKPVWSNQVNIIPTYMKFMATLMKFFGVFISIEACGRIITPLLIENQHNSLKKSGRFITWNKNQFIDIQENATILDHELQDKLWQISLKLCADVKASQIADRLVVRS
jgi:NADP-dependent 3-hydroxy acid dehydrogenase YdfG